LDYFFFKKKKRVCGVDDSLILNLVSLSTIREEAAGKQGSGAGHIPDTVAVVRRDGTVRKTPVVEPPEPGSQDNEALLVAHWVLEGIHRVLEVRTVADRVIRNPVALADSFAAFLVRRKGLRLGPEVAGSGPVRQQSRIREAVVPVGDHRGLRTLTGEG